MCRLHQLCVLCIQTYIFARIMPFLFLFLNIIRLYFLYKIVKLSMDTFFHLKGYISWNFRCCNKTFSMAGLIERKLLQVLAWVMLNTLREFQANRSIRLGVFCEKLEVVANSFVAFFIHATS